MALIMYLTRAPKYENVTAEDISLMESYFAWQHKNEIGGRHSGGTFKEWCGHSENELPNTDIINYYYKFWNKKSCYVEMIGETNRYGLFEQLTRIVKANQIFNWFLYNVMDGMPDEEHYELTKKQLEDLLKACNKVKDGFTLLKTNEYGEDEYIVNEEIAKKELPLLDRDWNFFGPKEYNTLYAYQIVEMIKIINNILDTTDFNEQTIYFNATR